MNTERTIFNKLFKEDKKQSLKKVELNLQEDLNNAESLRDSFAEMVRDATTWLDNMIQEIDGYDYLEPEIADAMNKLDDYKKSLDELGIPYPEKFEEIFNDLVFINENMAGAVAIVSEQMKETLQYLYKY